MQLQPFTSNDSSSSTSLASGRIVVPGQGSSAEIPSPPSLLAIFWQEVKKRKTLVVAWLLATFVLAALAALMLGKPQYRAEGRMSYIPNYRMGMKPLFNPPNIQTVIQEIKSTTVLEEVRQKHLPQWSSETFVGQVHADISKQSEYIDVSFDHADAQISAQITNEMMREALQQFNQKRREAIKANVEQLERDRVEAEREKHQANDAFVKACKAKGVPNLLIDIDLTKGAIADLEKQLREAKQRSLKIDLDIKELEARRDAPADGADSGDDGFFLVLQAMMNELQTKNLNAQTVESARVRLRAAKEEEERTRILVIRGVLTRNDYEKILTEIRVNEAIVKQAEENEQLQTALKKKYDELKQRALSGKPIRKSVLEELERVRVEKATLPATIQRLTNEVTTKKGELEDLIGKRLELASDENALLQADERIREYTSQLTDAKRSKDQNADDLKIASEAKSNTAPYSSNAMKLGLAVFGASLLLLLGYLGLFAVPQLTPPKPAPKPTALVALVPVSTNNKPETPAPLAPTPLPFPPEAALPPSLVDVPEPPRTKPAPPISQPEITIPAPPPTASNSPVKIRDLKTDTPSTLPEFVLPEVADPAGTMPEIIIPEVPVTSATPKEPEKPTKPAKPAPSVSKPTPRKIDLTKPIAPLTPSEQPGLPTPSAPTPVVEKPLSTPSTKPVGSATPTPAPTKSNVPSKADVSPPAILDMLDLMTSSGGGTLTGISLTDDLLTAPVTPAPATPPTPTTKFVKPITPPMSVPVVLPEQKTPLAPTSSVKKPALRIEPLDKASEPETPSKAPDTQKAKATPAPVPDTQKAKAPTAAPPPKPPVPDAPKVNTTPSPIVAPETQQAKAIPAPDTQKALPVRATPATSDKTTKKTDQPVVDAKPATDQPNVALPPITPVTKKEPPAAPVLPVKPVADVKPTPIDTKTPPKLKLDALVPPAKPEVRTVEAPKETVAKSVQLPDPPKRTQPPTTVPPLSRATVDVPPPLPSSTVDHDAIAALAKRIAEERSEQGKIVLFAPTAETIKVTPLMGDLGQVFARQGNRVLVFDARSTNEIPTWAGPQAPTVATRVEKYLDGQSTTPAQCFVPTTINGVEYSRTDVLEQVAGVMASHRFRQLIEEMRERYSIVLMVTPTLALTNDHPLLPALAEGVVLVTEGDVSPADLHQMLAAVSEQLPTTVYGALAAPKGT